MSWTVKLCFGYFSVFILICYIFFIKTPREKGFYRLVFRHISMFCTSFWLVFFSGSTSFLNRFVKIKISAHRWIWIFRLLKEVISRKNGLYGIWNWNYLKFSLWHKVLSMGYCVIIMRILLSENLPVTVH